MQGKKHNLSDDIVEYIRVNYGRDGNTAASLSRQIKVKFNYSIGAVHLYKVAQNFNVCKYRHWSVEENNKLCKLAEKYSPVEIARRMPTRTFEGIKSQLRVLGINRSNGREWYTATESAEILGVARSWVQKQIELGNLHAELYYPGRPTERGWWRIQPINLMKFIKKHPGELHGRNVDMVALVDLLTNYVANGQNEHYKIKHKGVINDKDS